MMTRSVFATSIDDIMQRTKFFQCFVCLQQFNQSINFPIQICERQHFMCHQCVESKLFKKNPLGNGYVCSLCSSIIDHTRLRRSSFLLSIKEFVEELVERQKVRRKKYKECMERQAQLTEELMNENILQKQKIEELQNHVKLQQEMLLGVFEQDLGNNVKLNEKQVSEEDLILPLGLLMSKIGLSKQTEAKKDKMPETFRSMFREIEQMKASIQQNEAMDKEEYKRQIDELQKHESYLYEIIDKQHPQM